MIITIDAIPISPLIHYLLVFCFSTSFSFLASLYCSHMVQLHSSNMGPVRLPFKFAYAHPPLFMFYASCVPSATSSTFHLYRVSWAALHPDRHTSHSCHAFTVSNSAIQLFLFPETSLCPHPFTLCASQMPYVACFAIHLFFVFPEHLHTLFPSHSMRCVLCALCRTSCHSSFLLFWGILAFPYFHILCTSCSYQPYAPLFNNSFSQQPSQSFLLTSSSIVLSVIS